MDATRWQNRAGEAFRLIDKALLVIANTAMVVIVLTVCWSVWTRYGARTPMVWAEDVTTLAFAWFIFAALAAVHNRRGHVSIDIVTGMFSSRTQALLARAGDVFIAVFCLYTAFLCIEQTIVSHTKAHTPVLKLPLSYFYASLVVGFALTGLRSVGYALGVGPAATRD